MIQEIELMQVLDDGVAGSFVILRGGKKKIYGFSFVPVERRVWFFSPELKRSEREEVKTLLTRRILRDTFVK
jgi:hypothetical protein